jgi:small redox-active disulfide protein 2
MAQDDHSRIRVGEHQVGVMGLKTAIEEIAETHGAKTDEEIQLALLERLTKTNYIPGSARSEYGRAFVREFRKALGQPYEEAPSEALSVVVLGPGCYQCDQLEQRVMKSLSELGLPASFEHITDIKEMAKYGFVTPPALIINGKIVAKGVVPDAKKIKEWLKGSATGGKT